MVAVGPHSWNATVLAVDGDEATIDFRGKEINYRWGGAWNQIRNEFREDGVGWINDESKWTIRCPRYADERTVLVNENAWDMFARREIAPDGNAIIEFDSPYASHVEGEIDPLRPGRILYRNAYGIGVHKAVGKWHGRSVRGEGLPIVEAMPAADQDAVFVERIITPMRMLGGWDGSLREIGATGCVLTTVNGDAGIRVLPAKAWYYTPAGELVTIPISVTVEREGDYVVLRKTIPRWFCAAAIAVGAAAMADETTVDFRPDANAETTSVDGYAGRWVAEESFAALIAGAGTIANDSAASNSCPLLSSGSTSTKFIQLRRGFYLFDTSSLDDAVTVTAAELGLYGISKLTLLTPAELAVTAATPASNTAIVAADYLRVGSVEFATRVSGSSWSTTDFTSLIFNAAGIASISLTGVSKYAVRLGCDVDGVAPAWLASTGTNYTGYQADQAGTTQDPRLRVTVTSTKAWLGAIRSRSRTIGGGIL